MLSSRPLLIYDGECGFCRVWIARWRRVTGDRVEYAPYQEVAARFPEIPPERFRRSVQLLEPDGRWSQGAEAVFRSLASVPDRGGMLWLYRCVPGFAPLSEACYRVVAANRPLLSRLTRDRPGPVGPVREHRLTAWIFLRLLALVYGIAFISLWTQILGIAGSHGILPAHDLLLALGERMGPIRYWAMPTLCWLDSSDRALTLLCAVGMALSLLLAIGVAPIACLVGLWACYLSLASVCREFLWFQWDSLLLEAGFLAIFLAPWRLWSRPGSDPPPRAGARWLLRWLLFRLIFSSAAAKLTSGDPTWRHLTALNYYYQTQPLPPWTAWYAHHLSGGFQKLSVLVMFAIEGVAPFFMFGPRPARLAAAATLVGFQLLIILTGNYGFFNILSIALCVLLLDDAAWPRRWGASGAPREPAPRRGGWSPWVVRPAVVVLFLLSLVPLFSVLRWSTRWLGPVTSIYEWVSPLRVVDRYGLFAVMTTERPEIIVEGSQDGVSWKPYEFRYKPVELTRRPAFVAPHMPRLDWQMWFAALSDYSHEAWLLSFCRRLLQGTPEVLALLKGNPFPTAPPHFIRAVAYVYEFTDAATRDRTGAWWQREPRGLYCPALMLDGDRLVAAPGQLPGR